MQLQSHSRIGGPLIAVVSAGLFLYFYNEFLDVAQIHERNEIAIPGACLPFPVSLPSDWLY